MRVETLQDILKLVDTKIEESLTLEYKKALNNKDIAKDISAFANTEGGTIIYGVATEDKLPVSISWLPDTAVEERIQNLTMTAIYPEIKGVNVTRLPNPSNNLEAVFVVDVPKSLEAPHMTGNRYYRRRGSVSAPMDDTEVKGAMFGVGRRRALHFETSQNLELANRTREMIDRVYVLSPEQRRPIALIPFHTDAWNAVVASGLLYSLNERVAKSLVEVYRLIYEINSLIEWLKVAEPPIVHTPAEPSSARHGTYLPAIIRDKLPRLSSLLEEITKLL